MAMNGPETLLALFTILCGILIGALPWAFRSSFLSRVIMDRILLLSFGIMLFVAWFFEPYVVLTCGWEGLQTDRCRATLIGRSWLYYAESFDPIFLDLPVWLRIMCSLDTLLFGPFYLLCLYALWKGRTVLSTPWCLIILVAGAGALMYSTLVYFAYEILEESHRASLQWVFIVNLPWTFTPLLLIARCRLAMLRSLGGQVGNSARLLVDCGSATVAEEMCINDVSTKTLAGQRELALVLIVDRTKETVLLEIDNDLHWRYHYGVELPSSLKGATEEEWIRTNLEQHTDIRLTDGNVRRAGTMLFSFQEPPALSARSQQYAPMRVAVYVAETPPGASAAAGATGKHGTWHAFAEIPYDKMWHDDIVWLPILLASLGSSKEIDWPSNQRRFEGHFIFDSSGPGSSTRLLNHNCQWFSS